MERADAYRSSLDGLRARLNELDAERAMLNAAISAIESLLAPSGTVAPARVSVTHHPAFKHGPSDDPPYHEAAEQVLREAGRPLHAKELGKRFLARGWYNDRVEGRNFTNSIMGSLDRKVRERDVFTKPSSGTYALIEWSAEGRPEELDLLK